MIVLDISNSMKAHPSAFHAYAGKSRPAIVFAEPNDLDEASKRIPPTSHRPHLRSGDQRSIDSRTFALRVYNIENDSFEPTEIEDVCTVTVQLLDLV